MNIIFALNKKTDCRNNQFLGGMLGAVLGLDNQGTVGSIPTSSIS